MRIGTYNVYGLRGYPEAVAAPVLGDPESATAAAHFRAVFQELSCDVLALQEGVSHRQMQQIAAALDLHVATFRSPLHWPGHLLSRYPILESRTLSHASLIAAARPFSRMAGAVLLSLPPDRRLWVVAVHLHPRSQTLRRREATIVRRTVQAGLRTTDQVVVLGDFNSAPPEPIHQALRELGFQSAIETVGAGHQPTFDATNQIQLALDYVYVSAALAPRLRSAIVVRSPGFYADVAASWVHSDHMPVVVELAWP
jgi:endonuclease/exonuclease/phosphatase family metal-dependent hydrolase